MKIISLIIIGLLLLAGCATKRPSEVDLYRQEIAAREQHDREVDDQRAEAAKSRRSSYLALHADTKPEVGSLITAGQFQIGMTTEEVYASMGNPRDSSRTVTSTRTSRCWVYRWPTDSQNLYLYFDDGILASWQN